LMCYMQYIRLFKTVKCYTGVFNISALFMLDMVILLGIAI